MAQPKTQSVVNTVKNEVTPATALRLGKTNKVYAIQRPKSLIVKTKSK